MWEILWSVICESPVSLFRIAQSLKKKNTRFKDISDDERGASATLYDSE